MSPFTPAPLKENDIRPDHLMAGQAERFAADVRRLLTRRAEFVDVRCPACEGTQAAPAYEKYGLHFVVCSACETMFMNPRPTADLLAWYHATSENYSYWNRFIFPASEDARRAQLFRPRAERVVELCRQHGVPMQLLLEVGAGFGTFCEELSRLGAFERVIAVEPTPDLAATCRAKGLDVIDRPIEHVQLKDLTVSVVASFETIEHLFSPREFVEGCATALAPGGILILTCPNVKGFDIQVLQALSGSVDVEHLNYFHPASLSRLLSRCGFDVLEAFTPGKLDAELVRKKALAGQFDLSSQPFLRQVLLEEWDRVGGAFQRFLAEHGLSSHMWVVARKRVASRDRS